MTTHTPGPWRRGQEGNLRIYGPDGQGEHSGLIATVHRSTCINLIVAAPEMRSALDEIFSIVSYINIHGVGKQPEPTPGIDPQPKRCPTDEFWRLFQKIGTLAADALKPTGDMTMRPLDESLCWIHNDGLAKSMAKDAIVKIKSALAKVATP